MTSVRGIHSVIQVVLDYSAIPEFWFTEEAVVEKAKNKSG